MFLAMIPGNENHFCAACHVWRPPGITFCYSVNYSWEFHTEDRGGRGRLPIHRKKEEEEKNNKLNRVWTATVSQVSWIFAMNSKLNRSSLYYWQRDMLIVLIICAVFAEPHRWTILKLCNWGLKIIYDLRALVRYLKIRRHEFSANRWQSMKFATTSVWL